MLRELWRKSCGCWPYLQLADPAKIGEETTNLQSLTRKVARICTHSGKAVKKMHPTINQSMYTIITDQDKGSLSAMEDIIPLVGDSFVASIADRTL